MGKRSRFARIPKDLYRAIDPRAAQIFRGFARGKAHGRLAASPVSFPVPGQGTPRSVRTARASARPSLCEAHAQGSECNERAPVSEKHSLPVSGNKPEARV